MNENSNGHNTVKCPNCESDGMRIFYEVDQVPVHSVLLMPTREEALNYTRGDIKLGFCPSCGFISNVVFDATKHEYSSRYEETQGFSGTFNKFHKNLAQQLIDKYDLHGKEIIEIGCGKGEFLTLLCEIGDNTGYGFDPAYISERNTSSVKDKIEFVKDFYSEKYTHYNGDFVACKMTLEHIPETADFMRTVRRSIAERYETVVFFQVPDMIRVLQDVGFWDIYYEHCSYFSLGSLARLFRRTGFNVIDLGKEYDDQYLMIESKPSNGSEGKIFEVENDIQQIEKLVEGFESVIYRRLDDWRNLFTDYFRNGKKVVLWGGGSKAVAFMTTLGIYDEVKYAVDINPYKHGTFLAGTGQEIVSPQFLADYKPDIVVVMNPIYVDEIKKDLNQLEVYPEIIPIDYKEKIEL